MEKRSKEIYTAELKSEVVKLVLNQGQSVIAVSQRMGIPKATLSTWVNKARSSLFASSQGIKVASLDLEAENKRLKQALARADIEGDILKKPWCVQLMVATHASSSSAGVQKFKVFRGR